MNIVNILKELWHQPLFGCFLAVIASFCFYSISKNKTSSNKIIWAIYYSIFAIAFIIFFGKVVERVFHPEVFDFMAFYLYGKAAVSGYDFYLPKNLQVVFNSLQIPLLDYNSFVEEIVNVGAMYPPPTMLLFAPFGLMPYNAAEISWTIFILLFVPGCIYLAYNLFFKAHKLNGLLLVATLFFLLSPVRSTVVFLQTNFILLFLLLLIKKYETNGFAGILLALAIFTKPYMIIFVLVFILRKQWNTILYFILSSFAIVGLTVIFFGKEPFISYIFNNPSRRLPAWVFSENINQSLNAVLLRSNLISIDKPIVFTGILFFSLLITAIYLFYLIKRKLTDYIWVVLLLVGLLLYPGTLSYYGVLLLFILFQFFNERNQLGFNMYLNLLIVGIFYYLSTISLFTCNCFLLTVVILKSIKTVPQNNFSSRITIKSNHL